MTLTMGSWVILVSYTEFYADQQLATLFDSAERDAAPRESFLLKDARRKAHINWESRREAFSGVFDVRLTEFSSWQGLDAAIWVRNAIAHGSGGITRQQKPEEAVKASHVGVSLMEGRLVLGADSVQSCSIACCKFVEELDGAARKAGIGIVLNK